MPVPLIIRRRAGSADYAGGAYDGGDRMAWKSFVLGLTLALGLSCGCAAMRTPREHGIASSQDVKKLIPVGTPFEQAEQIMLREGFECKRVINGSFTEDVEMAGKDRKSRTRANVNYLHCTRTDQLGFLTRWTWTVALIEDQKGCVEEILVRAWGDEKKAEEPTTASAKSGTKTGR
ncbi:MAG: hypothetical protein QM811_25380 [Pirellulales bacterium]